MFSLIVHKPFKVITLKRFCYIYINKGGIVMKDMEKEVMEFEDFEEVEEIVTAAFVGTVGCCA